MTEMVGLTCRVGAHNSRYAHDTRLYPILETFRSEDFDYPQWCGFSLPASLLTLSSVFNQ